MGFDPVKHSEEPASVVVVLCSQIPDIIRDRVCYHWPQ